MPSTIQGLAQKIAQRNAGKRAAWFAVLIGMRGEIIDAINQGWRPRYIWEFLFAEGIFTGSYDTFQRIWKKVLSFEPVAIKREPAIPMRYRQEGEGGDDGHEPIIVREPPPRTFSFDDIGKHRRGQDG